MASTDTLLATADRCILAYRDGDGPAMAPAPCWSDGGGLWLMVSRDAVMIPALRTGPGCTVWIAPPGGAGDAHRPGVVVDGTARVHDLSDPVGLALHAPTIAAALAALALTHRAALAGYVRDLPHTLRSPDAVLQQRNALIRVRIDRARSHMAPQRTTGIGPVLPTELPAAVRRALTGIRHVALATQRGDAVTVRPAVWGAGFQLDVGATVVPDADTPACLAVAHEQDDRPSEQVGLVLRGTVDSGFRFHPDRATWWQGLSSGSSTLRAPAATSGIILPD